MIIIMYSIIIYINCIIAIYLKQIVKMKEPLEMLNTESSIYHFHVFLFLYSTVKSQF